MYKESIPQYFIPKYAISENDIPYYKIQSNDKNILSIDMRFIVEINPPFYKDNKKFNQNLYFHSFSKPTIYYYSKYD